MTPFARILRAEEAAKALVLGFVLWAGWAGWGPVVAGLVLPEAALLFYALGPVAGARAYNVTHSYVFPIALFALSAPVARLFPPAYLVATPMGLAAVAAALNIAVNRALGFGLKGPGGVRDTHLGRIGGTG
jgi:hypothetical protein